MSKAGDLWRRVHGTVAGRPTNFSWIIQGKLAGSGMPTTHGEFEWIKDQGIRAVVTMTENPLPSEWTSGTEYIHLPTPDLRAPDAEKIVQAANFIHENIGAGRPVMVHCAAGLGRAGTILACYLVRYGGYEPRDAVSEIRRKRPGSIQSAEQKDAVMRHRANYAAD